MTSASFVGGRRRVAALTVMLLAAGSIVWPAPAARAAIPAAAIVPALVPAPAPGEICRERSSYRATYLVKNLLTDPITLRASDFSCAKWSGTGNPSNINGVQVAPAGRHVWHLDQVFDGRTADRWLLTVTGGPQADWTGEASLVGGSSRLNVVGAQPARIGEARCTSAFLAPTTEPASTDVPTYPTRSGIARPDLLFFSDGSHIVVRACGR